MRGILNGQNGEKTLKYPIKLRKVGSANIKKGNRLVTKSDGTVVNENDVTQSNNLIIPTPTNTGISTSSITDCSSKLRILNFTGFNAIFTLSATQLKLSIVNLNKNVFLNKTEFILKTGTAISDIAVEKLSETKIFVKYMDTITSTNIQVRGMVVDITNVANPTIMADTTIETYTAVNSIYNFQFVNVFTKSNGVHRVYFFGSKQYGGALFSYIDVSADYTSMTVTGRYTGTLDSNFTNYVRAQRTTLQVYSETTAISNAYAGATGYINTSYFWVYKVSLNHDTNVVTLNTNCAMAEAPIYLYADGFVLSNDKTFLVSFGSYNYTAGYGICLIKILINADWTLNTTIQNLYFGNFPSNISGATIRNMVIMPTIFNNKFLISFLYANGSSTIYNSYMSLVDITGMVSDSINFPTIYFDTRTSDYTYLNSRIVKTALCEYFQFGILNYGDTSFSCRVIDFDHVLIDAIAKGSGVLGAIIEVYQITNHE